jgi:hypothetical protein
MFESRHCVPGLSTVRFATTEVKIELEVKSRIVERGGIPHLPRAGRCGAPSRLDSQFLKFSMHWNPALAELGRGTRPTANSRDSTFRLYSV